MSDCSSKAFKVPEKPKLLPCPFHEESIIPNVTSNYYSDYIDGGWWAEAECPRCDVILTVDQCESEQEALKCLEKAWNTRWRPTCQWKAEKDGEWRLQLLGECGYSINIDRDVLEEEKFCPRCGGHVEVVD